jgi:hypothetical protein
VRAEAGGCYRTLAFDVGGVLLPGRSRSRYRYRSRFRDIRPASLKFKKLAMSAPRGFADPENDNDDENDDDFSD